MAAVSSGAVFGQEIFYYRYQHGVVTRLLIHRLA